MMTDRASKGEQGCEGIRDLIVWYPGTDLDPDERKRVEEHTASCGSCAELLGFATSMKKDLMAERSWHPKPEMLVRFVENRDEVDPSERSAIEDHLSVCQDCSEEAEILETVGKDIAVQDSVVARSRAAKPSVGTALGTRLRSFWDSLTGSLLRPVPAAVYLAVAVCALALLLGPPGWRPSWKGTELRPSLRNGTTVGAVTLLPDESGRVRGGPDQSEPLPMIDAGKAQFLLLEFTGLDSPPLPADEYRVEIIPEGSTVPAWVGSVRGEEFVDDYTLCLMLEPKTLKTGRYSVSVTRPDQKVIFRSPVDAR